MFLRHFLYLDFLIVSEKEGKQSFACMFFVVPIPVSQAGTYCYGATWEIKPFFSYHMPSENNYSAINSRR